jgi:O-antigen/teichoic acid export membrane protein
MKENLRKIIFKNTVANYLLYGMKMVTAIVITRLLFLGLGSAAYGFWALLWSVFGYSLLLDFGFGTSVQKYTAELTVSKDYDKYNRLLSTVFVSYAVMGVVIIILTLFLQAYISVFFKFPLGTDLLFYRKVFVFFGVGVAFVFPTGAFAEILKGLKQIYVRNMVQFVSVIVNVLGIYLIFFFNFGLASLAVFSLALNFVTNVTMAFLVFRRIPELKVKFRYFNVTYLKEVTSFSFFAYLIMFANMIIYKTDQIVLGVMVGMSGVAVYQIGSRLSFVMHRLSTQFQDNLAPIAASLGKAGKHEQLQKMLIKSNRLVAFMVGILFIIMTVLIKPILYVWLGVTDPTAIWIAYIMNLSILILVLFRSASTKFLLMTGYHKLLSYVAIVESISNVGLSVLFIKLYGPVGVAIGTLIPNLIVSVFVIFPIASRFSKVSIFAYILKIYFPLFLVSLPSVLLLRLINNYVALTSWNVYMLFGSALVSGILYALLGYLFFMEETEKDMVRNVFKRLSRQTKTLL